MLEIVTILPYIAWAIPVVGFLYLRYGAAILDAHTDAYDAGYNTPAPWRYCAPLLISAAGMTYLAVRVYNQPFVNVDPLATLGWGIAVVFQIALLALITGALNDPRQPGATTTADGGQAPPSPSPRDGDTADEDTRR